MSRNAWSGSRASRPEADIRTLSRLLFAAYFLETGFVLIVAPWTDFWDRTRFFDAGPAFETAVQSPYARGAVSGIGVVTMVAGLGELATAISIRGRRRTDAGEDAPQPRT
jgi:hypothetical protein